MISNHHILYLSHEGLTDPLGRSQVLAYIVELARLGYRFTVVTAEKTGRLAADGAEVAAAIEDLPVVWRWVPYRNRPPLLGPWLTLRRIKFLAGLLVRSDPPDLIHCRSLLMARIGQQLAQQSACPWLYDMRGFWPDERAESGLWPPGHPVFGLLYRYFLAEERRLEREAPHVVTLTDRACALVQQRTGRPSDSLTVIPCCVDLDWMQSADAQRMQAFRAELNLPPGRLVVGYLGSLGGWYLAEAMFACVALWRRYGPLIFLVVTTDPPERVHALAAEAGLEPEALRVRSAGRSEVPDLVQLMDVGLFFIRPCTSKQASSPTKLAEFLAAGKPVVTLGGVGDLDSQLRGQPFAYVLGEPGDAEFERAWAELPHLLAVNPEAARQFAARYYSLNLGVERYAGIYRRYLT